MKKTNIVKKLRKSCSVVATVGGRTPCKTSLAAKRHGADIIELRLDDIFRHARSMETVAGLAGKIRSTTRLPIIATVRSADEGGADRRLKDSKRLEIFEAVLGFVDLIDIELDSSINRQVTAMARKKKTPVIMSWHNFRSTPGASALLAIAKKALHKKADIVKIAAMAGGLEDTRRLLLFSKSWKKCPIAVIAMGEPGSISRIAGFRFNSCLTYGYVDKPFGPGQLSVKELSVCSGIEL